MTAATAEYLAMSRISPEELVRRHASLVKRIAYHLAARLPSHVNADDLIQAGMIGLLESAKHFDDSRGASFETYAGIRIRGAMLDELRKVDWAPRSVHRNARTIAEAIREVERRTGRDATDVDIAAELGMKLDQYHGMVADSARTQVLSMTVEEDERGIGEIADDADGPEALVERDDFQRALTASIKELPERERLVMSLYYEQELNLREIGKTLDITESRVCQIHGQALVRLRARLVEQAAISTTSRRSANRSGALKSSA
jgi:RNA polymerase sigma factor for flagellar operon FliA